MGTIHPSKVQTKAAVESGDVLVLTKPIGTGLISTAAKRGKASQAAIQASTDSMKKLNRKAAEIFANYPVKACTDVTGYSLLGHAHEMAEKSDICMHFKAEQVPFLPEAEDYAAQGLFPGGAKRNLDAYREDIVFADGLDDSWHRKLCCPETSGGLLAAVPKDSLDALLTEFSSQDEPVGLSGMPRKVLASRSADSVTN